MLFHSCTHMPQKGVKHFTFSGALESLIVERSRFLKTEEKIHITALTQSLRFNCSSPADGAPSHAHCSTSCLPCHEPPPLPSLVHGDDCSPRGPTGQCPKGSAEQFEWDRRRDLSLDGTVMSSPGSPRGPPPDPSASEARAPPGHRQKLGGSCMILESCPHCLCCLLPPQGMQQTDRSHMATPHPCGIE